MKVRLKGNKIALSEAPKQDVPGAFLILSPKLNDLQYILDAKKGQTKYDIPESLTRKDIEAVYLRVI